MFFVRPFATLFLLAALAVPAFAQEQRGSIEGIVRDASGAVLPGATVEATSNVGQPASTVSDTVGQFRFPSLAPGNYKVTANLQGFVAREVVDVRVALGQIKKVDFSLPLSGVTETVQVTAETPLVDVRQSARQSNIRAEQVELLPKGRDFTSLVTQAPGANNESQVGRPVDRRRQRRREPLHHRRHRDHRPPGRHLGQERARRLHRRSPGQVERLHRGIRRRHRRRDQRRDQERHQRLPRRRALQLRRQHASKARVVRRCAPA